MSRPMSVAALDETAPFPWQRLLRSADLDGFDRIVVVEDTAIPTIAAIYARAPLDTLKAWQAFHLADAAAPYLSKRFVAANFAFHSTVAGAARECQIAGRVGRDMLDQAALPTGRAVIRISETAEEN